ncbi:MAG: aminopeptidase N [Deltaproteobacteria bacterium]|nr:MAG: aminopeptidase N [Deltaproteobacteria bacterium]TNF25074.1 MAG: aminopeptidase N [Deltaproteobacteria bacterium]
MYKNATPTTIHLKDYKRPDYTITDVHLTFELEVTQTKVTNVMKVVHQGEAAAPLVLNGEQQKLIEVLIDGQKITDYELTDETLTLKDVPSHFELTIIGEINPEANKALDGLYRSGGIYCTQNEPEGFRRITYYIDRPDVMAKFKTKIIADKATNPILLSNGNPIGSGDLDGGKHWMEWEDPFPKPAYLYALVAGDLGEVKDSFTTMNGREIDLRIYCDKGNESKCGHAMESLKNSMKWDEDTYGLEYDLDIYMIVAVDSFNMGAMENKGLNVFNSAYVLANPKTATDHDFLGIEAVIGHEYFHNWTGNRITCRDWFQLTLKEGLTVFRDQEFSADMNSRGVKRIEDVQRLRQYQFVEDAGPTSHPIKPESYMEINNFYTLTIYEKGAEVIRMIHTMLGKDGFRRGMDKYFELYDGMAVTTEDFVHAMSIANGNYDLEQFKLWYKQSGTPELNFHYDWNEKDETLTMTVEQSCPPTPGQDHKKPYHMPLGLGLLGKDGKEIKLDLAGKEGQPQIENGILHLKNEKETFVFRNVKEKPVPSLNRGFTCPVKIHAPLKEADFAFIMGNDSDEFNRYEAGQLMGERMVRHLLLEKKKGNTLSLDEQYMEAYGKILKDEKLDPNIKAMMLSLPAEGILHQGHNPIDHQAIFDVREWMTQTLADTYQEDFRKVYDQNVQSGEFKLDPHSIGQRTLKNTALRYLAMTGEVGHDLVFEQQVAASNMTDEISALALLCRYENKFRNEAIRNFYDKWNHETLVMQKWLGVQASSTLDDTFERVQALEKDPIYDGTVPNLFRSLMGAFARNYIQFHHESGRGYKLIADKVIWLDKLNPQIAAGLSGVFKDYKKLLESRKALMKVELERIKETDGISKNTYEIVSKILG